MTEIGQAETDKCAEVGGLARRIWNDAQPADGHSWLLQWGLKAAYGLREYRGDVSFDGLNCDGALMLPMRDSHREIQNVAFLSIRGERRYLPGPVAAGLHFGLGSDRSVIVISEGFLRGAKIHQETGHAVAVSFNPGNVVTIAELMHERYPDTKIVLAAELPSIVSDNVKSATGAEGVKFMRAVTDEGEPVVGASHVSSAEALSPARTEAALPPQAQTIAVLRSSHATMFDQQGLLDSDPVADFEDAQLLLRWIERKRLTKLSRKQVMQFGPNSLRSAMRARAALQMLVLQGWLSATDSSWYQYCSQSRRQCVD